MRRAFRGVMLAPGLAAPLPALANAGIGLFAVALPITLPALVPAIVVEAPILAWILKIGFGRAFLWSAIANFVSTVVGAIIAVAADLAILGGTGSSGATFNWGTVLVALVPLFFVTWWLEALAVRRLMAPADKPSPVRATFAANAVSYALMAALVPFLPGMDPVYSRAGARSNITEVLAILGAEKTEVHEHFARNRRFPEPRPLTFASRYAKSMRREADGRLVAEIRYPGLKELDGARLVLVPRVVSGEIVAWECHSSRPSHRFMPSACRQEEPAAQSRP